MREIKDNVSTIIHFFRLNQQKIMLLIAIAWVLGIILAYIQRNNYEAAIAWCLVEYMYLVDFKLMVDKSKK